MADGVRGREKKAKNACTIPGVLLANAMLTSVNLFPQDGWLGFMPYDIAKFFVIIFCGYGGVSLLKDLSLYFMTGSQK
ncbi:hypothetical protein [Pantoea sp. GD03673]|uniref:hypothetical protein n=1 Tax=Pantoea sp. GD03673 TaxID=2975364 RepID=UPI00244B250E|nr:hypothetical protein [Pantoea sp. GD03673]MDH2065868.1 hypothetical protein [Pantoea sp. GD03673]